MKQLKYTVFMIIVFAVSSCQTAYRSPTYTGTNTSSNQAQATKRKVAKSAEKIIGGLGYEFGQGEEIAKLNGFWKPTGDFKNRYMKIDLSKFLQTRNLYFTPLSRKLYKIRGSRNFKGTIASYECHQARIKISKAVEARHPTLFQEIYGDTAPLFMYCDGPRKLSYLPVLSGNCIHVQCGVADKEKNIFSVSMKYFSGDLFKKFREEEKEFYKKNSQKILDSM